MLKMIVPYLGHAIEHQKLMAKNRIQNIFFNILEENSSKGIILLDVTLRLVYMNQAAKEFCRLLYDGDSKDFPEGYIPGALIESCRRLERQSFSDTIGELPLTCHRTFCINDAQTIDASSRILSEKISSEKEKFFLIYLQEIESPQQTVEDQLKNQYGLTARECEIVRYLYQGLKNSEIAKKVFLSEITVKKHLQSIFKKLDVSNRAAAVRKIAETSQLFN